MFLVREDYSHYKIETIKKFPDLIMNVLCSAFLNHGAFPYFLQQSCNNMLQTITINPFNENQ